MNMPRCWMIFAFVVFSLLAFTQNINGEKRPGKVDLCIILATNGIPASISKGITDISSVTHTISLSLSSTRLALITVDSKARLWFKFNSCVNRECIAFKLAKIRHSFSSHKHHYRQLKTKSALLQAIKLFKKQGRKYAKRYVLLVTDQLLTDKLLVYFGKMLQKYRIVLFSKSLHENSNGYIEYKNGIRYLQRLPFARESYTRCYKRGEVLDECNRKCFCVDGQLTKCSRVRKEFTEMSIPERRRYITAFKRLASDPIYKKRYENFVKIHKDLFFKGIHTENVFLPWHRWYLLTFENMLREIDCRITIPYWDWAFWSNVSWVENLHIWNSKDYGLGGNGDPKKEYCVQDGPFKEGSFKTPDFDNKGEVLEAIGYAMDQENDLKRIKTSNKAGCLRRSFNGHPIGVPEIKKVLKNRAASFAVFEQLVRVSLHNSLHNEIGGHMCSQYASVSPEFYLHHAFLDKLWYTWQLHSKACLNARFSNSRHTMAKFKCHHSQRQLIDSSRLPGHVNVTYTDYYYKYENKEDHDIEAFTNEDNLPEASYDENEMDDGGADDIPYMAREEPSLMKDVDDEGEDSTVKGFRTWPPYEKVAYQEIISEMLS